MPAPVKQYITVLCFMLIQHQKPKGSVSLHPAAVYRFHVRSAPGAQPATVGMMARHIGRSPGRRGQRKAVVGRHIAAQLLLRHLPFQALEQHALRSYLFKPLVGSVDSSISCRGLDLAAPHHGRIQHLTWADTSAAKFGGRLRVMQWLTIMTQVYRGVYWSRAGSACFTNRRAPVYKDCGEEGYEAVLEVRMRACSRSSIPPSGEGGMTKGFLNTEHRRFRQHPGP